MSWSLSFFNRTTTCGFPIKFTELYLFVSSDVDPNKKIRPHSLLRSFSARYQPYPHLGVLQSVRVLDWLVSPCLAEAAVPYKQQFTPAILQYPPCSSSTVAPQREEQVAASITAAARQFSELHGAVEPSTGLLLCSLPLLHLSTAPGQREKPLL